MTYFANSFSTRNAVIPCETGVFANARDGHRLSMIVKIWIGNYFIVFHNLPRFVLSFCDITNS